MGAMKTESPDQDDDHYDTEEADQRSDQVIRRLLQTPHADAAVRPA